MKIGTDGILLGAWANPHHPQRILDIGSGTGLLALMMAQRCPSAQIDAIEIDKDAWACANQNFVHSPWSDRLHAHHRSLQDFQSQPYDFLICNPPFFQSGLLPHNQARQQARHTLSLSHPELAFHSKRLSHANSLFALILPGLVFESLDQAMQAEGWHLKSKIQVQALPHKAAHRFLLLYSSRPSNCYRDQFCIEESPGQYSAFYRALTRDFYL